jgi:sporulation-control protein spo0M
MRCLNNVREAVNVREHTDRDVEWLLQEVDRYRRIDESLMNIIYDRNKTIMELRRRIYELENAEQTDA